MSPIATLFLSNQLESLVSSLKEQLFSKSAPFARRIVILPSPQVKRWVIRELSKELDVVTGIEWCYFHDGMMTLSRDFFPKEEGPNLYKVPDERALSIGIEAVIRQKMEKNELLGCFDTSLKMQRKIPILSQKLASLFLQYGLYARGMVEKWEKDEEKDEEKDDQERIWKELFGKAGPWSTLSQELSRKSCAKFVQNNVQIHFFAHSFIPAPYWQFLIHALAPSIPCYFYALSPSQGFWSDLLSDRDAAYMLASHQEKEETLWELLYDRNPLLANWGKVGRIMAKQYEETELVSHEAYMDSAEKNPATLLHAVQKDLLFMQVPEKTQKIDFAFFDHSIELHVAPSLFREVEILYDRLLYLKVDPSDILVIAPDIKRYIPYIKAVFGRKESVLTPQILDGEKVGDDQVYQCFSHLICLAKSRFTAQEIFDLLHFPEVRASIGMDESDLLLVKKWFEKASILWGFNAEHRDVSLQNDHCEKKMVEKSEQGTFESGFYELLQSLIQTEQKTRLSITEGPLLGKLIYWLRSLHDDLKVFGDKSIMTISDWVGYLKVFFESYMTSSEQGSFFDQLKKLEKAADTFSEVLFPWSTVLKHLQDLWEEPKNSSGFGGLQGVQFSSMLPVRSIPARLIAVLGLEEGVFPRPPTKNKLSRLKEDSNSHYCPSPTEFDRYLFLETLLSAREHLIFSYSKRGSQGEEALPSLVLTELFSALDQSYTIEGSLPSQMTKTVHPFFPSDSRYFDQSTGLISFSQSAYLEAKKAQISEKPKVHAFLAEKQIEVPPFFDQKTINLGHFLSFANNPLRTYLQKSMGIYFPKERKQLIPSEEPFSVNPLTTYQLKQELLKTSKEEVIAFAEKKEMLPLGLLKKRAKKTLEREFQKIEEHLAGWELQTDGVFRIILSNDQVDHSEKTFHFPPISLYGVHGEVVHLVGEIGPFTRKGWLVDGKEKGGALFRWLPHALLLSHLPQELFDGAPQLLFLSSGRSLLEKPLPKEHLSLFFHYYQYCLHNASPFIPEWVEAVFKKEPLPPFPPTLSIINPYLSWLFPQGEQTLWPQARLEEWRELGMDLFGESLAVLWPKLMERAK